MPDPFNNPPSDIKAEKDKADAQIASLEARMQGDTKEDEALLKLAEELGASPERIQTLREKMGLEGETIKEDKVTSPENQQKIDAEIRKFNSIIEERLLIQKKIAELKKHGLRQEEELRGLSQIPESTSDKTLTGDHLDSGEKKEEILNPQEEELLIARNREIDALVIEKVNKADELDGSFFKDITGRKTKKLDQGIEKLRQEQAENDKKLITIDRTKKPFLYYAASSITDPNTQKILENREGIIDLRWADKDAIFGEKRVLFETGINEGFFEFNILGFKLVIKNVKELRSENGINYHSPEAIYKVVGPDGTIITDNIKGYDEASKTYIDKTWAYKLKLEQEFNSKAL